MLGPGGGVGVPNNEIQIRVFISNHLVRDMVKKTHLRFIPSPKADPGPARRARAPPFWKKLGFVVVNFDCITRIYFDFTQYIDIYYTSMLNINNVYIMYFIHYSCYKHIGYVWRGIKTNPKPKNCPAPGPRPPPRFEIPGSATVLCEIQNSLNSI